MREEGRRAIHDYLMYVMYTYRGMERKKVESGCVCEREEVCVFDKNECDLVSKTCVNLYRWEALLQSTDFSFSQVQTTPLLTLARTSARLQS